MVREDVRGVSIYVSCGLTSLRVRQAASCKCAAVKKREAAHALSHPPARRCSILGKYLARPTGRCLTGFCGVTEPTVLLLSTTHPPSVTSMTSLSASPRSTPILRAREPRRYQTNFHGISCEAAVSDFFNIQTYLEHGLFFILERFYHCE
jgi:hypothetical protein